MRFNRLLAAAVLTASVAAFAPAHAATLKWAAQNDVITLDPHSQNHATTNGIMQHVYEGLVRYDKKFQIESALATGSVAADPLVKYLENPATTFDIGKGPGVGFRPWDHQLRQPLYTLSIDQEIEWVRIDYQTWVGLGKDAKQLPAPAANAAAAVAALDRVGDLAADSGCRMPA